mgnify:FL=1
MKNRYILILLFLPFFFSCGEKAEDPAAALLEEARKECEAGNFNNARMLLDSLSVAHPTAYKTRREAEIFRREVMIKEKERDVLYFTSEIERLSACRDSLVSSFTFNKNSRYQDTGYYTSPLQPIASNAASTYLRASLNEDGTAFIVSFYRGRAIEHTTVKVSSNGYYAVCDKPYSSRSYREYGVYSERRDYKYGEDGGIMDFIAAGEAPFVVELSGGSSSHTYTLRASDVEAIKAVAGLAVLLRDITSQRQLLSDAQISLEILRRNSEISKQNNTDIEDTEE